MWWWCINTVKLWIFSLAECFFEEDLNYVVTCYNKCLKNDGNYVENSLVNDFLVKIISWKNILVFSHAILISNLTSPFSLTCPAIVFWISQFPSSDYLVLSAAWFFHHLSFLFSLSYYISFKLHFCTFIVLIPSIFLQCLLICDKMKVVHNLFIVGIFLCPKLCF